MEIKRRDTSRIEGVRYRGILTAFLKKKKKKGNLSAQKY